MPEFPITWRFLTRRGWLLVLGLILGVGTAWALSGITVSATSSFSVRTIGRYQPPYQPDRLALTYAQLLPDEPVLIDAVSSATHLPAGYVRKHLTMTAVPETNILIARFSAGSGEVALAGLRGLAAAFESATDSTGASLRATVRPIGSPAVGGGMTRKRALLIGAVAGLLMAVSLALTLDRRRPRVDSPGDLARVVDVPISQVGRRSTPAVFHSPVVLRKGESPKLIETASKLSDRALGKGQKGVLVVARGTPVIEIEEALRSGEASGVAVAIAMFVNYKPPIEL